jgi:acid phosphatase type 7
MTRKVIAMPLAVVAAIFALYAAFVLGQNSSLSEAQGATTDTVIQAETMTLSGLVVRLTNNGTEVAYYTNGRASATYTGSISKITLNARSEQCNGAPVAEVFVDGTRVGSISVTTTALSEYPITTQANATSHQIRVEFNNDSFTSTCDGNLYLDKVTITSQDDACPAPPPTGSSTTLVAAGDIATGGIGTPADQTAQIVEGYPNATVLALGDLAYPDGTQSDFINKYDPTWGRFKARTKPVPGNHEVDSSGNYPYYYTYFGGVASQVTGGNYSFDVGSWHIVAINTAYCGDSNSACASGSQLMNWLNSDLQANTKANVLAYFHHPLFSSESTYQDSQTFVRPIWDALYAEGADVILNGHAHLYERFAPQTPQHVANANGIREFIVGTGGTSLRSVGSVSANSQFRDSTHYGVLKLTLRDDGYDWEFLAVGGSKPDSGSTNL